MVQITHKARGCPMPKRPDAEAAPRRGRTPSINARMIEQAIRKVATGDGTLTMHGVADNLGVSVTTLYRHTGGLEGLYRIYTHQVFEQVGADPSAEGQNWREWMMELAEFYRNALLQSPDLLKYAQAALDPGFERLERATRRLVEYGFEPREAVRAHAFLVNNVVGYVHQELQARQESNEGITPTYTRLSEILQSGSEGLPTLSGLNFNEEDLDRDANFRYFIVYAMEGIAAHTSAIGQTKAATQECQTEISCEE